MALENLINSLKRHEGLRLKPYTDTTGNLTIGIGRNLDGRGITEEEANFLLMNDILTVAEQLGSELPWTDDLDDARRHVLLNMAFNMGIGGLLQFTNTLKAAREQRWDDAARGMLDSKWATQVGHRATELAEQMRTGIEK